MRINTIPYTTSLVKMLDAQSGRRSFAFLYITNKCNIRCRHCSFKSGRENMHTHMDTDVVIHAIDELAGIHDITITGGEPLLHPEFTKILSHSAKNASLVYLMTNGIRLIGKENLKMLAQSNNFRELKQQLIKAMEGFPKNLNMFFPLDSFHMLAFRPFAFLLYGLASLARKWNNNPDKPFIGFLSNEVSIEKSIDLISKFGVKTWCHIGTASFSPWRKETDIRRWYISHHLNQIPFPGGIYINYKGVYLNEASLLMDLRQGIEMPLKIGRLTANYESKKQLYKMYRNFFKRP